MTASPHLEPGLLLLLLPLACWQTRGMVGASESVHSMTLLLNITYRFVLYWHQIAKYLSANLDKTVEVK